MSATRDLPELRTGAGPRPTSDRLALRLDEVAQSLGVARRTLDRARAAGRFPRPDVYLGRVPLWTPETIRAWIAGGDG
jgi:predicted DNA-binding transcriptional regulator AlpA